jgi:hypothetical protein
MAENHTTTSKYNVLDVRELVYADNSQSVVLICKEYGSVNRRRIVIFDDDKVFEDAKMLVPGDFIVVHDNVNFGTRNVTEIEY